MRPWPALVIWRFFEKRRGVAFAFDHPLTMDNSQEFVTIVHVGLSSFPVIVTTRIITFLVGNPYKPSFPLLLGRGTKQGTG